MIKQLQTKILKLEQTIERIQKDFQKQKQNYQRKIQNLQTQNKNLNDVISEMNLNHQSEKGSLSRSSDISHLNQQQNKLSDYRFKQGQNSSYQNQMQDLVRQNNYLKEQIANISITYQRQIDQLTQYFEKIRSSSRLSRSSLKNINESGKASGKVSLLMNAYESVLKSFDSERQKYAQKIEQLTKYIIWSQQKNKQLSRQKYQFQVKSRLSDQQLRIYKQNLMM